jgi:hypothetical protein
MKDAIHQLISFIYALLAACHALRLPSEDLHAAAVCALYLLLAIVYFADGRLASDHSKKPTENHNEQVGS